jgi:hypothetical protein
LVATNVNASTSQRLSVASRIVAAVVGGYAAAGAVGAFLAPLLPMARADAVLTMTLASFAVYAAAILWAFAARSARLAWLGLLVPIVVCGGLAWLIGNLP